MSNRQDLLNSRKLFISCVVPVYNEQEVIIDFLAALQSKLIQHTDNYEIIIIDDGSKDSTLEKITTVLTPQLKVLALARNFGKENALTAGLEHAKGEVVILVDADFQHPLDLIDTFFLKWVEGYDMAYGVRASRTNETALKRFFAKCFYSLTSKILEVDMPVNAGDFRLLSRDVVDALNKIEERNRFMKGLYAWVGFKSIGVPFVVAERVGGKSSWGFWRLTELAITGITSFSNLPLRFWSFLGLLISLIAFIYGVFIVLKTLIVGVDIPGYATLVVAILFLGGIQLLSIGILGEYIARIFTEVKHRPKYIVAKKINF